jgi:hypothetical protein
MCGILYYLQNSKYLQSSGVFQQLLKLAADTKARIAQDSQVLGKGTVVVEESKQASASIGGQVSYSDIVRFIGSRGPDSQNCLVYECGSFTNANFETLSQMPEVCYSSVLHLRGGFTSVQPFTD